MTPEKPDIDVRSRPDQLPTSTHAAGGSLRHKGEIVLVPRPTTDPNDPLNWSKWRKLSILLIVSVAAFTGLATSTAHLSGLVVQAKVYHVTPSEMTYTLSSVLGGLLIGPFFWVPVSKVIGSSSCIFWSLLGLMACAIWSANLTSATQYIKFVFSRLIGGIFGATPQILGNGIITDMFFVHERGRAFALYSTIFMMGSAMGPTFGDFIVSRAGWPAEYWWTIGLQGLVIVLTFLFLEETRYERKFQSPYPGQYYVSTSWIANRIATFFPGTKVIPPLSMLDLVRVAYSPFEIFFSPVSIMIGVLQTTTFGWYIIINSLLPVFLQEPYIPAKGLDGYSFTPTQTGYFSFCIWIGILIAQLYSQTVNDYILIWIARRNQGRWCPEYRLHSLWFSTLAIMPIGLALFGCALKYHLHYMVLATGSFLVTFSAIAAVPIPLNYLVEAFGGRPQEVGVSANVYRLIFAVVIPFFLDDWEARVGVNWVFGMAAFLNIFAYALVAILIWKGRQIRRWNIGTYNNEDEKVRLTAD